MGGVKAKYGVAMARAYDLNQAEPEIDRRGQDTHPAHYFLRAFHPGRNHSPQGGHQSCLAWFVAGAEILRAGAKRVERWIGRFLCVSAGEGPKVSVGELFEEADEGFRNARGRMWVR